MGPKYANWLVFLFSIPFEKNMVLKNADFTEMTDWAISIQPTHSATD